MLILLSGGGSKSEGGPRMRLQPAEALHLLHSPFRFPSRDDFGFCCSNFSQCVLHSPPSFLFTFLFTSLHSSPRLSSRQVSLHFSSVSSSFSLSTSVHYAFHGSSLLSSLLSELSSVCLFTSPFTSLHASIDIQIGYNTVVFLQPRIRHRGNWTML